MISFTKLAVAVLCPLGCLCVQVRADARPEVLTWNGGGEGADWDSKDTGNNNWGGKGNPRLKDNDLVFAGSARTSPNMQADYSIGSITFNHTASPFILRNTSGTTLTLDTGGVVNNGTDLQTINISAISLRDAQTWNAASGPLSFGGSTIANGGHLLTFAGGHNISVANSISGNGGLTKTGTGVLSLDGSAANTYTGGTTLSGGTVSLAKSGALGSIDGPVTFSSGRLDLNGHTVSVGALSLTDSGGALGLNPNGSGSITFAGVNYTSGQLIILDWKSGHSGGAGDRVFISDAPASGDVFWSSVKFFDPDGGAIGTAGKLLDGELVPANFTAVPEPINVALGIFGAASAGIALGRRYLANRKARKS